MTEIDYSGIESRLDKFALKAIKEDEYNYVDWAKKKLEYIEGKNIKLKKDIKAIKENIKIDYDIESRIKENIKKLLDEDEEKYKNKNKEKIKDILKPKIKSNPEEEKIPKEFEVEAVEKYLFDVENPIDSENKIDYKIQQDNEKVLSLFVKKINETFSGKDSTFKGHLLYSIYNYLSKRYNMEERRVLINFIRDSNNTPDTKIFIYICILHNSMVDIDLIKDFIKEFLLTNPSYDIFSVVKKVLFFLKDNTFSINYCQYFNEKIENNIVLNQIILFKLNFIYKELFGADTNIAKQEMYKDIRSVLRIKDPPSGKYELKDDTKKIDYYMTNIDAEIPEQKEFAKYLFLEKKNFCHLNPSWINNSILYGKIIMLIFIYNDLTSSGYQIIGLSVISSKDDYRSNLCEGVKPGKCAEISTFCTDLNFPGLGTPLMNYVKNTLISKGYDVVTLSSVDNAVKFYTKRGYKKMKDDVLKDVLKRYLKLKEGDRDYIIKHKDDYLFDLRIYFIGNKEVLEKTNIYKKLSNIDKGVSDDELKLIFKIYKEAVVDSQYYYKWKDTKDSDKIRIEKDMWKNIKKQVSNLDKERVSDDEFIKENTISKIKNMFLKLEEEDKDSKDETFDDYVSRLGIKIEKEGSHSFGRSGSKGSIRSKLKKLEKIRSGRRG